MSPGEKDAKADDDGLSGTGESLESPISSGMLLGQGRGSEGTGPFFAWQVDMCPFDPCSSLFSCESACASTFASCDSGGADWRRTKEPGNAMLEVGDRTLLGDFFKDL
mmetsp:Transcript_26869/g.43460  ORF Transcript_26869/g.43460 Transcript_26869/m.43460 type:complete len:108 (-) Transcript_26869:661-984(-)